MNILTSWLREYLPAIPVDDKQLADDLTLRGIAVEGVFEKGSGHLYEMDITTNRVDAMNHYGIAREASAIYNLPLAPLDVTLPAATSAKPFPVRIEDPAKDLCGRFTVRVIRDVKIGASTGIVSEYFDLLDEKKIFNAVDASNFVLFGMGQPTHAFDLDKLEGGIVVRRARKGEKLKLLDGTERTLFDDDLVVADEKKALALAGVMGGWETMITPATKNILVEAAWFDPAAIRRSSRRHLLHTDASHRFERGADFNAAPIGNNLVCKLILEQGGGTLEGELIDIVIPEAQAKTANRPPIALAVSEVRRHLGTTLAPEGITPVIVEQYLTSLGCKLTSTGAESYSVTLPSWRLDLEREIDLIEEIARVYGYNQFANTLPTPGTVVALPNADKEETVRTRMLALGFSEAIASTFCSTANAAIFSTNPAVAMGNPLSEEAGILRPSLLPGMLATLAHNLNRDVTDLQLFEMGNIFFGSTRAVTEELSLVFGAAGAVPSSPLHSAKDVLFFELKGDVEDILSLFSGSVSFDTNVPAWLHPGRAARVLLDGKAIGCFGEVHPAEAQRRKLKQSVVLCEINLTALFAHALRQPVAKEPSRYQAVQRDFSFVFADTVDWSTITAAIGKLHIPTLTRITPQEIFRDAKGKAVPAGHYSILLRTVLQSNEATLTENELQHASNEIIAALANLGGRLRA
ncbi:MAG TPA: phenylalanine--tRNA ligase subunit beta [Acidobacteriaceae bacterium]|jgi:phenylalanyl-tRNA synthetase beta chain|nr:phenylalanine--tRNA ligase subunit beta [Acidobacteriaceae bacterium]